MSVGRRGPKPDPTAVKILKGNPRKKALNDQEAEPELAIPERPQHLKGLARQEWDRVARELFGLGLLSNIDRAALAFYCSNWAMAITARRRLAKETLVIADKPNPRIRIAERAEECAMRYAAHLGMSPSARTAIRVEKAKPKGRSEFEKFRDKKRGTRGKAKASRTPVRR